MKFNFLLKKAVGAFLLGMLCISLAKAGDPIQPSHSNWGTHRMSTHVNTAGDPIMCVDLDEGNMLHIKIYVNLATNYLENQLPIYLGYTIVSESVTGMVEITPSNLVYDINKGVWTATIPIDLDLSSTCARNGENGFSFMHTFTLFYQLYTPDETYVTGWRPYPMQNQTLWPYEIFGLLPAYDPLHVVTKNICCNYAQPKNLTKSDDITTGEYEANESVKIGLSQDNFSPINDKDLQERENQTASSIKVAPNPFSDNITIQFTAEELGSVKLECLDAQGRVVKTEAIVVGYVGQQSSYLDMASIPAGLYYLRISTASGVKMTKMVKTSN